MPIPRGTKKSDKARAYQNQWDAENYKTAACKIRIADYEKFKAYAESQGKSISKMLSEYINSCIGNDTEV